MTVLTTTFIWITVWKPRVKVPSVVGSWTRPKTPMRVATAAPAANAASGSAMLRSVLAVVSAMGPRILRPRPLGKARAGTSQGPSSRKGDLGLCRGEGESGTLEWTRHDIADAEEVVMSHT